MRPHDKFHFTCALGSRVPNWYLCRQRLPLPAGASLVRSCYPCSQCVSLPAGAFFVRSCFPMALRPGAPVSSTSLVPRPSLPIGPLQATCSSAPRLLLPINALAGNLHIGAPAGNKPHLAEKSTPVWLAIWHTWAGFANSQHRDAANPTPKNICSHFTLLPPWTAAQTDANLSAHLHRLPTPPPYLRQMRLLPGRDAGVRCWMRLLPAKGADVRWQMLLLVVRGAVPANHRAHESLF